MNKLIQQFKDIRKDEHERTFWMKIKETFFCHFWGHRNNISSPLLGKYVSRHCQVCYKRKELW